MLFTNLALLGTLAGVQARSGFDKLHRRSHAHHHRMPVLVEEMQAASNETEEIDLAKRGGQCAFPYGSLMVPVTPGSSNAGWAMSPDQPCLPGSYCPYACAPGYLMDQWDPSATTYSYPQSMNGGLHCGSDGTISKPFPDRDYCKAGMSSVSARNAMSASVAFCQTVLPGNEAMLIPTTVYGGSVTGLAVPDTSYWASTAAHYYINPAGVSASQGCVWGSEANPWGNWSPYVAGANTDGSGNTFVKIGWNPIYAVESGAWKGVSPSWAVSIECTGGNCNGIPCRCDPSLDGLNKCNSGSDGAGGAAFCVVTVPPGGSANIVVYDTASGTDSSAAASKVNVKALQAPVTVASSSSAAASTVPSTTSTPTYTPEPSTTTTTSSSTTTTTSTTPTSTSTTTTSTTTSSTTTSTTSTTTTTSSSSSSSTTSSSSSSSLVAFSFPAITSSATVNATTTRFPSAVVSLKPVYQNVTASYMVAANAASSTPTLLGGGAGYDNLVAAASSTARAGDEKSDAQALLRASPLLMFLGAVVVLSRL